MAVRAHLVAAIAAAALGGCSTQTIDASNAAQLYDAFSKGTLHLSTGLNAAGSNVFAANRMFDAAVRQDWPALAKVVIQANSGDDIGYYYLGMAAEGLGFADAARAYYGLSIDVSNTHSMPPQCTRGPGALYYQQGCHGLVLPRDAVQRLRKLGPGR